jgi:hypothetical protein
MLYILEQLAQITNNFALIEARLALIEETHKSNSNQEIEKVNKLLQDAENELVRIKKIIKELEKDAK